MDILGRIVNETNFSGTETKRIDLNNLQNGLYILKIFSEQNVYDKKLIRSEKILVR